MKIFETKKIAIFFLLSVVFLAFGFWGWQKMKAPKVSPEATKDGDEEVLGEERISETVKNYQDPELGLSFDYPDNFTSQKFTQDDGAVVVIQGRADDKNGFQVMVAPYEESEELSLDLIKSFAQDLTIKDEKEIFLGEKVEIQAFSFALEDPDEEDEDLSTFKEVWFVRNGKLYQISSDVDFAIHMEKILKSLRLN